MYDVKAFWRSKTLWGVLLLFVPDVLTALGFIVSPETALIVRSIGGSLAAYGRVTADSEIRLK